MNEENWVRKSSEVVSDKDIKALKVAKNIERERLDNGYRYVKLTKQLQICVPCDDKGRPTEEGRDMIQGVKISCGIG